VFASPVRHPDHQKMNFCCSFSLRAIG
jgi:hypothetical protein